MMKDLFHAGIVALALLFLAFMALECSAGEPFSCTTKTQQKKGEKWVFSYTYPEISAPRGLMGARGNVKDFNSHIKKDVHKEEKSFMDSLKSHERPGGAPDLTDERRVVCTPVGLTSHYCSFMFDHYEMVSGMAHPSSWYTTVTWSADGKYLSVNDLFKPGTQGLERLSQESGKLLKARFGKGDSGELLESGWAPKAENFKYFCISPTGLHIYFNYYQLGARPLGAPAITIPWKTLDDVISPMVKDLVTQGKM